MMMRQTCMGLAMLISAALPALGGTAPGLAADRPQVEGAGLAAKLHPSLRKVEPDTYYSTTLHILSLIALQERYPECL